MTPGVYNFKKQYKGDTLDTVRFTFKDKDSGDPIDISGVSFKCEFRSVFNKKIVDTLTDGDGITIEDAVNGIMSIDPFIITWDAGVYNYDIQLTFPDSSVKTYVKGTINIVDDTTL